MGNEAENTAARIRLAGNILADLAPAITHSLDVAMHGDNDVNHNPAEASAACVNAAIKLTALYAPEEQRAGMICVFLRQLGNAFSGETMAQALMMLEAEEEVKREAPTAQ